MDIYLSPDLSLQARRQASNSNDSINGRKAYVRHLPPKHMDLPLRPTTFVEEDEDFPTPKASQNVQDPMLLSPGIASSVYSPLKSPRVKSPLRESVSSNHTTFEEDLEEEEETSSENDSEIVQFQVSDSIKKRIANARTTRTRVPSLIIPSPHLWPNINRGQQSAGLPALPSVLLSPDTPRTPLSPAALAKLDSTHLRVPLASTATPSLDDTSTTDEQVSFSCPSTPDLLSIPGGEDDGKWDLPLQLHPDAMLLLSELSVELPSSEFPKDGLPLAQAEPIQMTERGLSLTESLPSLTESTEEDISPISIPSPGGFFATLSDGASGIWLQGPPKKEEPNTSTAETFYGVPWRTPQIQITLPQIIEVPENGTDGPPTARRILGGMEVVEEPESITMVDVGDNDIESEFEASDIYAKKVSESAESNKTRTDFWIEEQERYLARLKDMPLSSNATSAMPSTPEISNSSSETTTPANGTESTPFNTPPPKKTVRFAEIIEERPRDSILYHAFQHLRAQEKPRDAFIHRDARINALRMQRLYMKEAHIARLKGAFDLTIDTANKQKQKQHFLHANTPTSPDEKIQRATLAQTSKEQRALSQLTLSSWTLQSYRTINDNVLLPASTVSILSTTLSQGKQPRILDFGGQPTASWGWAVACHHRDVKVYTAVPTRNKGIKPDWLLHRGPSNHRIASVPNAWTLPFPSDMFTVISARTLHTLLRTNSFPLREGEGGDEFDACLRELYRVLAPGGVLHFEFLDAEVNNAPTNSAINARAVEFAVALKGRGFDTSAGRKVQPRLEKAGFEGCENRWVDLAWIGKGGGGEVTGLLGSAMWEQWMLGFQTEHQGKTGEDVLAGVAQALDEARGLEGKDGGAIGWRVCVGSARKV